MQAPSALALSVGQGTWIILQKTARTCEVLYLSYSSIYRAMEGFLVLKFPFSFSAPQSKTPRPSLHASFVSVLLHVHLATPLLTKQKTVARIQQLCTFSCVFEHFCHF